MKEITVFKTTSWGGKYGKELESRYFETESAARENAKQDTENTNFYLYKVKFQINGEIKQTEKRFLAEILCGNNIKSKEL